MLVVIGINNLDSFTRFNLFEGLFWICLGIVFVVLSSFVPKVYHKLCSFAGIILLVFGVSDFAEIGTGSFLPGPWWLLTWKIINMIGLVWVVVWYFKLRLKS